MNKKELEAKGVTALRALAKRQNIPLPAGAKKSDIINTLLAAGAGAKKKARKPAKGKASGTKKPAAKKGARKAPSRKPEEAPESGWKLPPGVEEPMLAQARMTQSKYDTGAQETSVPPAHHDLPQEYGEDTIVLAPRDPFTAHVYWEVTPDRVEKETARIGGPGSLVVRVYDVTGISFDGTNAHAYHDYAVSRRVGNRYCDLDRPAHTLCAEVGLLSREGVFTALARSQAVVMPKDRASDASGEERLFSDEEYEGRYGGAGGPSSMDVAEGWRRGRLAGITSPGLTSPPWARRR